MLLSFQFKTIGIYRKINQLSQTTESNHKYYGLKTQFSKPHNLGMFYTPHWYNSKGRFRERIILKSNEDLVQLFGESSDVQTEMLIMMVWTIVILSSIFAVVQLVISFVEARESIDNRKMQEARREMLEKSKQQKLKQMWDRL
eukprot:TRINITY_DN8323_c1_g1_i1.p3 TRINITY_DN8323_c1_g1~~TRINITY_DN8323_c1_g1_i1.p3  ORF type:complete len:143 (-),score=3.78 TRINITY_DN8323_c1_g1_i1:432-860(-)